MSIDETLISQKSKIAAKFAVPAAIFAIVGIVDASYLTSHRNELIPCSVTGGCEMVLNSAYAQMAGVPLSILGLVAYIVAFLLIISAFFLNRKLWFLFGIQVTLMALFSVWLIYVQAFILHAFCQYCLLSAGLTFTMFIIALISKFWRFR